MVAVLLAAGLVISLAACGGTSETGNTADVKTGNEETADDEPAEEAENTEESTQTYGSGDYTRINPAMDEHCEINVLLFNGLTAHDADDQVVPGLAESWDYDEDTYTYTFHIRDGIKWHDGEPFTADDVKRKERNLSRISFLTSDNICFPTHTAFRCGGGSTV